MIIIQYILNCVNGKLYNIQRLILYIFVIFTFMISGEYSYCSGKQTFDVKYIPSVDNISQIWSRVCLQQIFLRISVCHNVSFVLQLCLMCSEIKVLILGICGIIRSLSRVLLGFVIGVEFDVRVLCQCDVLGDILFICVGFIRI